MKEEKDSFLMKLLDLNYHYNVMVKNYFLHKKGLRKVVIKEDELNALLRLNEDFFFLPSAVMRYEEYDRELREFIKSRTLVIKENMDNHSYDILGGDFSKASIMYQDVIDVISMINGGK